MVREGREGPTREGKAEEGNLEREGLRVKIWGEARKGEEGRGSGKRRTGEGAAVHLEP